MSRALYKSVLADLTARKDGWEEKQRLFYEMRHEGLRRKSKPFPEAADLHYPLTDGMVDKLKPYYFAQIFGQELLADFTPHQSQPTEFTEAAARWFDFQLKECSNFGDEFLALIDLMLTSGVTPIKVRFDQYANRLEFDAIDPLFLVVPPGTIYLEEADRLTHILQMTVGKYRRDQRFSQDPDLIKRISGKGVADADSGGKMDEKCAREGITYGATPDDIVIYEVYEHHPDGWSVHTFSPGSPDEPVRPTFRLPAAYLGCPFVEVRAEVKDKGYYAARGLVEKEAPFEIYLSRVWNEKADGMTWRNRPLFTHSGPAGALNNLRMVPGQIVPNDLKAVQMGQTPFDFAEEMHTTREIAESHAAMPDFGLGRQGNRKDSRTATEITETTQQMSQSTDLRGWIAKRDMRKLFRKAWELLRTYAADQLRYEFDGQSNSLPPEALTAVYTIAPAGTPEGWNKNQRRQQAQARAQLYGTNPYVDQAELTKHVLEEDDPRLVRRLFKDPQTQAASQAEDQAGEILLLREGWPCVVEASDDDNVHLQTIFGWAQKVQATGEQVQPVGIQRLMQHVQQHLQQLGGKDKNAAAQWQQQFAQLMPAMPIPAGAMPAAPGQPMPGQPMAPQGPEAML